LQPAAKENSIDRSRENKILVILIPLYPLFNMNWIGYLINLIHIVGVLQTHGLKKKKSKKEFV
jgi:hypothetical protein